MTQHMPTPVSPATVQLGYAGPGTRTLLPVEPRAGRAILAFKILLAFHVLSVLIVLGLIAILDPAAPEDAFSLGLGLLLALFALGITIVQILAIVFYCMWQHRVHRNAEVLARSGTQFTPGWGVGYWFIPILNLFRPFQVVREIHQATPELPSEALGNTIGAWWTCMIASIVLNWISSTIDRVDPDAYQLSMAFNLASTLLDVVALVLVIRIIRSITNRQRAIIGE